MTVCKHWVTADAAATEIVLLEVAGSFVKAKSVESVVGYVRPVKQIRSGGVIEVGG